MYLHGNTQESVKILLADCLMLWRYKVSSQPSCLSVKSNIKYGVQDGRYLLVTIDHNSATKTMERQYLAIEL